MQPSGAVERMFETEDRETASYVVDVLGEEYVVLPGVFSPKVRRNSAWFAEKVPPLVSGRFLEIGAGAGVLAVICAKKGAEVVATDISPEAVENVRQNAEKHGVAIDVRLGSVFEPIAPDEGFDAIFWNHPWLRADEPVSVRYQASYDHGYRALRTFLEQGKDHLAPGGSLLLGTGSLARLDLIEAWAEELRYRAELVAREAQPLQVGGDEAVDFMIWRFTA